MKKWIKIVAAIVIVIILVVFVEIELVNKNSNKNDFGENYEKLEVATLSGPTGFGLAYLFDDENYNVTLYDAPDQISAALIKGEINFATIPTNMAAILSNKTNGKLKILSVIAEGNLYILTTRDDINSLTDLAGKTVTLSGKGATPEVIANDLLGELGITFDYKAEHSEVVTLAKTGRADIIMVPEPYVTIAQKQIENIKVALDINELWDEKYPRLSLPMGCLVMNNDYLTQTVSQDDRTAREKRVDKLLNDVAKSILNVNKNVKESSKIIEEKQIIKMTDIAESAIPNCNIVYISSGDAKEMIDNYFNVINNINPSLIGGKIPNEEIYY